jgi:hypothetical protein
MSSMKMMKMRPDASETGRALGSTRPSVGGAAAMVVTLPMARPPMMGVNTVNFWSTPSSKTWKSSAVKSGTNLPSLSRTVTSVLT